MVLTKRFLSAFVCILVCQTVLFSQVLTMEGAVEATLSQYPTLAAQRAALEAIRANARVVRDNRLPNVRLHDQINVGTANGLSGSYFSLGLIVPTSGGRRSENRMDLASGNIALATMDWEVYNFGRFKAEDQLARTDISVSESALERERFGLRQVAINTYLDLLQLNQQLKIEERNLARVDTIRRIITNLVRNGIKPGLDSSLVMVQVSKAKMAYWQVLESYQQAITQLATLTGRPSRQLQIDTVFSITPALTMRADPGINPGHPLLNYRENVAMRQAAEIDVMRKAALPRVSLLTAAWARGSSIDVENNYGSLGSGLLYSRGNVLAGVAITVNLTDFRRSSHRVQLQQFRIKEADSQLATEQLQLRNMMTAADSVMAVMQFELREIPKAIRSAADAYDQRLSRYNNGLENILGLTDALQLLVSVEKDYVLLQSRAAKVQLQKAYATNNFEAFFALFRH
ncbi:TolC family protein [Runella sp.]|uniref:TolC family protein n=1 Tax=Runella sp. TaxID=1960881 RepID=UPI003D0A9554